MLVFQSPLPLLFSGLTTASAENVGTKFSSIFEEHVVRIPSVRRLSFTATRHACENSVQLAFLNFSCCTAAAASNACSYPHRNIGIDVSFPLIVAQHSRHGIHGRDRSCLIAAESSTALYAKISIHNLHFYSNVFGTMNILSFSPGAFFNVFSPLRPFVTHILAEHVLHRYTWDIGQCLSCPVPLICQYSRAFCSYPPSPAPSPPPSASFVESRHSVVSSVITFAILITMLLSQCESQICAEKY